MSHRPFISVCIPAYQRVDYLRRLLDSLVIQSFQDFEVVVTDDSPDDSVAVLCQKYSHQLKIIYQHNHPAKGTPANWNVGLQLAKGEWIKIIHDDDWLVNEHALAKFASVAQRSKSKFIFSAYQNVFESNNRVETKYFPFFWRHLLLQEPMCLLAYNKIGPPSVVMMHHSVPLLYDERLKWRVDMEYYVRLIKAGYTFEYISASLVNIGVSDSQVTQSCLYIPEVELPEGYLLLQEHGVQPLQHILVYDAWWRLLRNLEIRDVKQLQLYVNEPWPAIIQGMVEDLAKYPPSDLKKGLLSKLYMWRSFQNRKSLAA